MLIQQLQYLRPLLYKYSLALKTGSPKQQGRRILILRSSIVE